MGQRKRPFITRGKNNNQSNVLHRVHGPNSHKATVRAATVRAAAGCVTGEEPPNKKDCIFSPECKQIFTKKGGELECPGMEMFFIFTVLVREKNLPSDLKIYTP